MSNTTIHSININDNMHLDKVIDAYFDGEHKLNPLLQYDINIRYYDTENVHWPLW